MVFDVKVLTRKGLLLVWLCMGSACVERKDFTPVGGLEVQGPSGQLIVREGKDVRFSVTVIRGSGQTGEISLTAVDLPPGLTAAPVTLPAGESEATIQVMARGATWGQPGSLRVVAEAYGEQGEASVQVLPIGPIGAVDTTFGTRGEVSLPTNVDSYQRCWTWGMSEGKTLVLTAPSKALTLTRIRADGSLDTSFASGGTLTISNMFGSWPRAASTRMFVHVLSDDRFYVFAAADDPNTTDTNAQIDGLALMRYLADGRLDTTFAFAGEARIYANSRPLGLGVTPAGDVMVWRRDLTGGRGGVMTRFTTNGQSQVESSVGSLFGASTADMVMQDDGKPVVVGQDATNGYLLARFTTVPALDVNFGRGGMMPTTGVGLNWSRRADGGHVVTGARYDYPAPGSASAWIMEFDRLWRASPGYANGGVALTSIPTFISHSVDTYEGGNLVVVPLDGAAYSLHLLGGVLDLSRGPNGLAPMTVRTTGGQFTASGPHTALLSWGVTGQSCELLRVWR